MHRIVLGRHWVSCRVRIAPIGRSRQAVGVAEVCCMHEPQRMQSEGLAASGQ